MIRPYLLSAVFVLMFCGYAAAQLLEEALPLGTWKGKTREDLIVALGPPTHETTADNGVTTLTWEQPQRHSSDVGRTSHTQSSDTVCIREIDMDPNGIVIGVSEWGCQ